MLVWIPTRYGMRTPYALAPCHITGHAGGVDGIVLSHVYRSAAESGHRCCVSHAYVCMCAVLAVIWRFSWCVKSDGVAAGVFYRVLCCAVLCSGTLRTLLPA